MYSKFNFSGKTKQSLIKQKERKKNGDDNDDVEEKDTTTSSEKRATQRKTHTVRTLNND